PRLRGEGTRHTPTLPMWHGGAAHPFSPQAGRRGRQADEGQPHTRPFPNREVARTRPPEDPMDNQFFLLASITATVVFAGLVRGVTGMGLPTVAMGVLGALISPLAAATLLILPSFVTNVWQLAIGPDIGGLVRRLWPMMLAVLLGTIAFSSLLAGGNTTVTTS